VTETPLRRPADGECFSCGWSPAAQTVFTRQAGMVLMNKHWTERASYCKGCATEAYRRCQAWNLARGWWGVISFFMNIVALVNNSRQMGRLRDMPPPQQRAPEVVTPRTTPSDGGQPVFARPESWVLVAVVLLIVLVNVF